jgi:hypothetical protein
LGLEEIDFRGIGPQFTAARKQVESGIVMAFLPLEHGFVEEDVIVALGRGLRI